MNKIRSILGIFTLVITCTFSTIYPYIYKGMIWRRKKAADTYQYVYGAADYHAVNKPVTRAQKRQVINAFKRRNLKKQKLQVIVEDIDSYEGTDNSVKLFDEINNKNKKRESEHDSFLAGMYTKLQKMKIPVINVECRHAKTLMCDLLDIGIADDIALEHIPSIKALGEHAAQKLDADIEKLSKKEIIESICKAFDIKVGTIVDELKKCMNEIKKYKDGSLLNGHYKSLGNTIMSEGRKIISAGLRLSDFNKDVWSCLQKRIPVEKQQEVIDLIRSFNAPVLDIKALHAINKAEDADRIFLFMGGQHIKSIGSVLEKMGYEKVYDSGTKRLVSKDQEATWHKMPNRTKGEQILDSTPVYEGVNNQFFKLFFAPDPSAEYMPMAFWETVVDFFYRIIQWLLSFFS